MKFLKGLALALLSFFLFLSLSIFGLAFTLNNTILNPDFVVSELDKFDVSSLAGEVLSEQIPKEEFPEEFETALINTITKVEPLVKEQLSAATYSIYDYLLGKSQSPELALTLRNTLLGTDFVVSLVDELDIASLAGVFLTQQLTEEIPEEMEYLIEYLDDILIELEPWVKQQISVAADPILDYLLGESQSFNVVISLEPVMESLKDTLKEAFLESVPPEYANLPQSTLDQYFEEFFAEFTEMIPATFELDESLLGTELPAKIAEALATAEGVLEQGREVIGYFQLGYKLLIVLIVLLIAGIILLNRQIKGACRRIGSTFLSCGVPWYAGIFVAKHFAGVQIAQLDIPSYLQGWLPQFLDNFLAPLEMLSLGLLIGGIALIIVSFVYKPRQPSS